MEEATEKPKIPFIQAVIYDEEKHTYTLNEEAVQDILGKENIRNKPVVIISVAGAFRKGKSFLLNFFIRFLIHVQANGFDGSENWIGEPDEPLWGFPWRGGSERETTGILLWRKPFVLRNLAGDEVIILLMDTQGAFDSSSTVKDCAMVFAISTMISSVQIYNISSNLQEDYLAHLQLFTEYGRIALETSEAKPFQDLLFLIRDWSYPYEYDYGYSPAFLDKKLAIFDNQHREIQSVREHIKNCFENVELFLLPHPGIKVAVTPNFDGRIREIDSEFVSYIKNLITNIISPVKLKPKISQGVPIKCCDVITFFKAYLKIFQSDTLPEPKSMIRATAEANNLVAINSAKQLYRDLMNEVCGSQMPYVPEETLKQIHTKNFTNSMTHFSRFKKFGDLEISNIYRITLEKDLLENFSEYEKFNHSKRVNSFKIIITAFLISLISFLISSTLDLIGLDIFMMPFNVISIAMILVIIFCSYAQFYGGFSNILYQLNLIPDLIISQVKTQIIEKYMDIKRE